MKNNASALEIGLARLLEKYGVNTTLQKYNLGLVSEASAYSLLPGWQLLGGIASETLIPLMPWRFRRSLVELRNLVQNEIVQRPCLLRFCFFTDETWTLEAQLYRELDIVEFVTGSKAQAVHTVLNRNRSGNVIVTLANGALCSMEVSNRLPLQASFIERHEIICERGVASDMVVDTQAPQSSVYLYTGKGRSEYTDYDAELYGLDADEIDLTRAAYAAISEPQSIRERLAQHDRLEALVRCVLKSGAENRKISISENLIYETN